MDIEAPKTSCNICGGWTFFPGPGNRQSSTGLNPRCGTCHSLERHRALRALYESIRSSINLENFSCLQVSKDLCVKASWFASHAVSIYDEQDSIDIQKIDFGSGSFDCVICNHVLEHVADDRSALAELFRIVNDRGFLQIGVPDPARMKTTRDWGYPDWSDHGHFRKYGIDIVEKLREAIDGGHLVLVSQCDPVTEMNDLFFIMTRSEDVVRSIEKSYPSAVVERSETPRAAGFRGPLAIATPGLVDPVAAMRYIAEEGHRTVQGWVAPGALTAIAALEAAQRSFNVRGHVSEIGVHHGRLFIALSLLRTLGERSLAIDVFGDQDKNVDKSGLGDRQKFDENCKIWMGENSRVSIISGDSLHVTPDQITHELGGKVRLFSVDGSHTVGHTLSDIRLAEQTLVDGGIAIVDDFLNPAWPEVVEAMVRYLSEDRPARLEPICYGDNKFYLTTAGWSSRYADALLGPLSSLIVRTKAVTLCGAPMHHIAMAPVHDALRALPMGAGDLFTFEESDARPVLSAIGGDLRLERAGAWLVGAWAGLALVMPDTERCVVTLTLGCHRHPLDPEPMVQIFAAGQMSAVANFADEDVCEVSFMLPARSLGASRRLELWLHNPRSEAPAALGVSADRRRLLALLVSVRRRTGD